MLIARLIRYGKVQQKCKLPFDGIRCNYSTAIIPKPPLYNSTLRLPSFYQPNFQNVTKSVWFSSSSFVRLGFSRRRPYKLKMIIAGFLLANICIVASLYLYYLNKVPYTHRYRPLIHSHVFERKLVCKLMKKKAEEKLKGEILGATHPHSVKVCSILKILLDALHKDLGIHEIPKVSYYDFASTDTVIEPVQKEKFWRVDTSHLKGLNWQVLVIDKPEYERASSSGGGIIFVNSGLLDRHCDVEIATVIANEVGHIVAQHFPESLSLLFVATVLHRIHMVQLVDWKRLSLAHQQRAIREADYIALRLMASAGYNPRAVLQVYEDGCFGDIEDQKYNPVPMKERIRLLSQPHIMEEASAIYRQTWQTLWSK